MTHEERIATIEQLIQKHSTTIDHQFYLIDARITHCSKKLAAINNKLKQFQIKIDTLTRETRELQKELREMAGEARVV